MTPMQLMDTLSRDLKELLCASSEWTGAEFHVCIGKRPPAAETMSYACIIPEEGMDRMEDSTMAVQGVMVELYVSYEAAGDDGWRDVFGAIERIRERFKRNALLGECFEVLDPITWIWDSSGEDPGFRGTVHLLAELPQLYSPGVDI